MPGTQGHVWDTTQLSSLPVTLSEKRLTADLKKKNTSVGELLIVLNHGRWGRGSVEGASEISQTKESGGH